LRARKRKQLSAVHGLNDIDDPAAQELEATLGFGVDIDGMIPAAATALERFQRFDRPEVRVSPRSVPAAPSECLVQMDARTPRQ
jgi:hypothetical protein